MKKHNDIEQTLTEAFEAQVEKFGIEYSHFDLSENKSQIDVKALQFKVYIKEKQKIFVKNLSTEETVK